MPPPSSPLALNPRRNHLHTDSRRKILAQDSGRDLTLKPRSRPGARPGAREGAPGSVLADGGGEG